MQQNINPENLNEKDYLTENKSQSSSRIMKIKGKPFWLNLSKSRIQNYSKYKSDSQSSTLIDKIQDKTDKISQKDQIQQQTQFIQSIQSFNQNYDEDFQSYKSTIKHEQKVRNKIPLFPFCKSQQKNLNTKINRIELSLVNSPQRKYNAGFFQSRISQKILKKKPNIKTEPNQSSQKSFNITKDLFMIENTMYLRCQNQKIIRKIQQIRKILPFFHKNKQQIFEQQVVLNQLNDKVRRAIQPKYQWELQQSKSQTNINKKIIQTQIKLLNSSKNQKKLHNLINDDFIIPLSHEQKVRQKLISRIKIHCLRQQKDLKLVNKIKLYEQILEKISGKQKIQSHQRLQRRKTFLEWDIQRLKNQIDLKIIQQKVDIESLKDQIKSIDNMIEQYIQLIVDSNKIDPAKIKIKSNVKQIEIIDLENNKLQQQKIEPIQQPNKEIKSFILKRKLLQSPKNNNFRQNQNVFLFKRQKQEKERQPTFISQSSSIYQIQSPKKLFFEKQQSLRQKKLLQKSNKNISILIKKTSFHNQNINEELQELIL